MNYSLHALLMIAFPLTGYLCGRWHAATIEERVRKESRFYDLEERVRKVERRR
jgi:hypothetical protein